MSVKMQITGFSDLHKKLAVMQKQKAPEPVLIGYSAPYAIHVHENMMAHHPNGEAKFLVKAIIEQTKAVRRYITKRIKAGDKMQDVLIAVANMYMDASDKKVPVATGALRASRYVKVAK